MDILTRRNNNISKIRNGEIDVWGKGQLIIHLEKEGKKTIYIGPFNKPFKALQNESKLPSFEIESKTYSDTELHKGLMDEYSPDGKVVPETLEKDYTYFVATLDIKSRNYLVEGYKSKVHAAKWTIPVLDQLKPENPRLFGSFKQHVINKKTAGDRDISFDSVPTDGTKGLIIQAKDWISGKADHLQNGLIMFIIDITSIERLGSEDEDKYGITGSGTIGYYTDNNVTPTGLMNYDGGTIIGDNPKRDDNKGFYILRNKGTRREPLYYESFDYFIATKVNGEYVIRAYVNKKEADLGLWKIDVAAARAAPEYGGPPGYGGPAAFFKSREPGPDAPAPAPAPVPKPAVPVRARALNLDPDLLRALAPASPEPASVTPEPASVTPEPAPVTPAPAPTPTPAPAPAPDLSPVSPFVEAYYGDYKHFGRGKRRRKRTAKRSIKRSKKSKSRRRKTKK